MCSLSMSHCSPKAQLPRFQGNLLTELSGGSHDDPRSLQPISDMSNVQQMSSSNSKNAYMVNPVNPPSQRESQPRLEDFPRVFFLQQQLCILHWAPNALGLIGPSSSLCCPASMVAASQVPWPISPAYQKDAKSAAKLGKMQNEQ